MSLNSGPIRTLNVHFELLAAYSLEPTGKGACGQEVRLPSAFRTPARADIWKQSRLKNQRRSLQMKRLVCALAFAFGAAACTAQSLDDLNIQIHGYATQGFLYSTRNNIFTTTSSDGSPSWTEAVLNVTAQPAPKLRIGVQGRYFLLGDLGNSITLDWAAADYKADDRFGVRFGKVKTPSGLLNEIQDIDPSYMWSLLPQSIYPIESRNSLLAHFGGVVYGTVKLGPSAGKLEYRGWGGERSIGSDDGYFVSERESGIVLPNGLGQVVYGAALHWKTPLPGLMVGASTGHTNKSNTSLIDTIPGFGTFNGSFVSSLVNQTQVFGRYEKDKLMVAGEYSRLPSHGAFQVPHLFTQPYNIDYRDWYAMASYKLTGKLSAGVYDSQFFDHRSALGPARYQKDWAISGRYDFSQFVYAKAEQHFIDGTVVSYDTARNPGGLKPTTRLTILKIGVSF